MCYSRKKWTCGEEINIVLIWIFIFFLLKRLHNYLANIIWLNTHAQHIHTHLSKSFAAIIIAKDWSLVVSMERMCPLLCYQWTGIFLWIFANLLKNNNFPQKNINCLPFFMLCILWSCLFLILSSYAFTSFQIHFSCDLAFLSDLVSMKLISSVVSLHTLIAFDDL